MILETQKQSKENQTKGNRTQLCRLYLKLILINNWMIIQQCSSFIFL